MRVTVTSDVEKFAHATDSYLRSDPIRHTVLLTVVHTLLAGGSFGDEAPTFAWAHDGDDTVGCALQTPPFRFAVSPTTPEAATAIGVALRERGVTVGGGGGVAGEEAVLTAVARGLDAELVVKVRETQYRLDRVVLPPDVPGVLDRLSDDDVATYEQWSRWFEEDVGIDRRSDPRRMLDNRRRAGGELWLWRVDGAGVAMAGMSGLVEGTRRVGPVFTPREQRGRGYAAMLTAVACAEALASDTHAVTLFADADNPTPNGVYRRIGFVPVGSVVEGVFA